VEAGRRPGARGGSDPAALDDAVTRSGKPRRQPRARSPVRSSYLPWLASPEIISQRRGGPRRGTQPQSGGNPPRPSESHRYANALKRRLLKPSAVTARLVRCCRIGCRPRRAAYCAARSMPRPRCGSGSRGVSDPARGARRRPQARPAGSLTPRCRCLRAARFVMKIWPQIVTRSGVHIEPRFRPR
jgi:hypothetical protein